MMRCPFCTSRLRRIRTKSAILDACPQCNGIWFDTGELVKFAKSLAGSDQIQPKQTKLFQRREVRAPHTVKEKDRICPRCNAAMHKFNYSYDSNIYLDKCPNCGGIWADAGEAEQVAAYLKEDPRASEVARCIADSFKTPEPELKSSWAVYLLYLPRIIVPFSDDTPRQRFPVVTVCLIIFAIFIFVLRLLLNPYRLAEALEFVPEDFFGIDLVASLFSQGGPLRLIWNVLFLWLFGDNVEDKLGRSGYLLFVLCCAIIASALYSFFKPDMLIPAVGITSAVSAVMGAYLIFYPTANVKVFVIYSVMEVPAALCLGLWFLFQLLYPFLSKAGGASPAIYIASVGGFIFGAAVAAVRKSMVPAKQQNG